MLFVSINYPLNSKSEIYPSILLSTAWAEDTEIRPHKLIILMLEVFYYELFLSSRDERTTNHALAQLKNRLSWDQVAEDDSERKAEVRLDFFYIMDNLSQSRSRS